MYCRKCGNQIPNDSLFCLKCGEKIAEAETQPNTDAEDVIPVIPAQSSKNSVEQGIDLPESSKPSKTNTRLLGIAIGAVVVLILLVVIFNEVSKCSLTFCDKPRMKNSQYCINHGCPVEGCNISKLKEDTYCTIHADELCCSRDGCSKLKVEGGGYCSSHTCKKADCLKGTDPGTDYCYLHQIKVADRLQGLSWDFSLNSVGGIELYFSAQNASDKTIKYVRFQAELYNAVGDQIRDDFLGNPYINVEIIGPVESGEKVKLGREIVGYCSNCEIIRIRRITIIYTDGTSEVCSF